MEHSSNTMAMDFPEGMKQQWLKSWGTLWGIALPVLCSHLRGTLSQSSMPSLPELRGKWAQFNDKTEVFQP